MKELLASSFLLCRTHRDHFKNSFLALFFLSVLYAFPWQITGLESGSGYELLTNFFIGMLELLVTVNVINTTIALRHNTLKERLIYTAPAFFIGSLVYVMLSMLGLVLFIVPGLWCLVFLVFVPLAKIISPEESAFKKSKELVRKSPFLVVSFVFFSLLIEFIPTVLDLLGNWQLKILLNILIAAPWAVINILFINAFVRLYYQLEAAHK